MSIQDKIKGFKPFTYFSSPKAKILRICIFLFFNVAAALNIFWTGFCHICLCPVSKTKNEPIFPMGALDGTTISTPEVASFKLFQTIMLVLIVLCILLIVVNIIRILFSLSNDSKILKISTTSVILSLAWVAGYTVCCFVFSPINKLVGGLSYTDVNIAPLISAAIVSVVHFAIVGILLERKKTELDSKSIADNALKEQRKKWRISLVLTQLELLAFAVVAAGMSTIALLANILSVKFTAPFDYIPEISLNGIDLLIGETALETKGERALGFIIFALLFITLVSLFVSIIALCGRSALYNKLAVFSVITSSSACLLVGLFGQYYEIVQSLNADMLIVLLTEHKLAPGTIPSFTASSSSLTYFFILLGVLTILLLRRPYTRARELEKKLFEMDTTILASSAEINISSEALGKSHSTFASDGTDGAYAGEVGFENFDPCPAFTELDNATEQFSTELEARKESLFDEPTLPALVDFIVQYARDSRLHLFYTPETIAAFLAGLGSTKLTILQGMSGTGKTSLPKIVAEALYSSCDIVEVESSWRDKNELLGYYNEFSKIYTPKKFTQALYKAALNPEVLTFIILDEMNLSRIEYYFSDFLSLMEHEENKREIKLLNVPIHREIEGKTVAYTALCNGHTVKIPSNIWFIGTANRDESTYDISDKVYDRAHTLNFDKRAKKPLYCGENPIPVRYLPPAELIRLFEEAKASVSFSVDGNPIVEKVDELLSPYNISFGNRVATQIESFVKIYATCFSITEQVIHEALDTILLSKVVKKLELKSIDDKEYLVSEFEKLGLKKCTEFISSLKED